MSKTIDKKLRAFVVEQAKKAAWNIGVSHFKIDIEYMAEKKIDEERSSVQGEMLTDRRYLHGTMKLYPPVLKMWADGKKVLIKDVIHHEIAHLATQHLYDLATSIYKDEGETKDAWESLTEVIAKMSLEITNKS